MVVRDVEKEPPLGGYREPAPATLVLRPLGSFALSARLREVQRALAVTRLVCLVIALIAYFLPWHDVQATSWFGDGGPVGEPFTCTGWSHGRFVLVPLIGLAVPLLAPMRMRARLKMALMLHLATLGVLVVFAVTMVYALHFFDHVTERPAGIVYDLAMLWIFASTILGFVVEPLLYAWQRRRLPPLADSPLPSGRTA